MRLHTSIALGAMTVALAAVPGTALAKGTHHAKRQAAPVEGQLTVAEQLAQAQQQLAQMQAQLNALQARLDAQATAAPQMAQATQAAQGKADEAQATATVLTCQHGSNFPSCVACPSLLLGKATLADCRGHFTRTTALASKRATE